MEAARKFEEAPEKSEKEPHYNFPEIAELEPAMISLVEKLKDKIERGEYDTLISDDVGGRIPTLILRKIMLGKGDYSGRHRLNLVFVPGGRSSQRNPQEAEKVISNESRKINRTLLVSEWIETGKSIRALSNILEKHGVKNFDVAAVYHSRNAALPSTHSFFGGATSFSPPELYGTKELLSGVEKVGGTLGFHKKEESARLNRTLEALSRLSEEEIAMESSYISTRLGNVQKDLNKAREDVDMMADKILKQVWENE